MPAKSEKQEKFMQAVAHNKSFAKKVGVPQSVGQEFTKSGGGMKKMNPGMMAMMKKKAGAKKMAMGGYADGGVMPSKMGAVKTAAPSRDGVAVKGKTKGKQVVMAGNKRMNKGGKTC